MGIKNNKRKNIAIALSSVLILVVVRGIFLSEKIVSSTEEASTENDIPVTIIKTPFNSEGFEIPDNEEILRRYDKVNKNSLTYDTNNPTTEHLSEPYAYEFYETEQGFELDIKENSEFKPINDKKYSNVLLGYSLVDLNEPLTREEALDKADLVLPKESKEVRSRRMRIMNLFTIHQAMATLSYA